MAWVKLDDQFFSHPKVLELTKDAKLLYLVGLTYCAAQLTDGRISAAAVRLIASTVEADATSAAELVAVGLWEPQERGYLVHDYLRYNPSGEQVRRDRDANAKRQAAWRERQALEAADADPQRRHNGVTDAITMEESNAGVTPLVTPLVTPAPSPPLPVVNTLPAGGSARAREAPPAPSRSKRGGGQVHPALQVVREVLKAWPVPGVRDAIVAAVGSEEEALVRWRTVCLAVGLHGVNPRNMACALDWFRDGIPERRRTTGGSTHGSTHGSTQRQGDEGSANWPTLDQQAKLY